MKTLIEELRAKAKSRHISGGTTQCEGWITENELEEILSRHDEQEPLAVLADRKGVKISKIENCHYPVGWLIHLIPKNIKGTEPLWQRYDKTIEIPTGDNVDTYAAAEQAAKAYLESLPDKEAK